MTELAIQAHELAIDGYKNSRDLEKQREVLEIVDEVHDEYLLDINVINEYRALIKTLSTPEAIRAYGLKKLRSLRKDIKTMRTSESEASSCVSLLSDIELILSEHADFLPGINSIKAERYKKIAENLRRKPKQNNSTPSYTIVAELLQIR